MLEPAFDPAHEAPGASSRETSMRVEYARPKTPAAPSSAQARGVGALPLAVVAVVGAVVGLGVNGSAGAATGPAAGHDHPSRQNVSSLAGHHQAGAGGSTQDDTTQDDTSGVPTGPQQGQTIRRLALYSMPQGLVTFSKGGSGMLTARVSGLGFTPGSAHAAVIVAPGRAAPVVNFSTPLTADGAGEIEQSTTTAVPAGGLPAGSRFEILLGTTGGAPAGDPIAQTDRLPGRSSGASGAGSMPLKAVEVNSDTRLRGNATLVFDPARHELTVTVDAGGLSPGAHAFHIHTGSCADQGDVQYALADLRADSRGRVVHQTQTVEKVTSMPASGSTYLNIHQGDMNSILSGGQPTLLFRPLLCGNI